MVQFKKINILWIVGIVLAVIVYSIYKNKSGFQDFLDCTSLSTCKSCANAFGCMWCAKSAVCVSDNSGCVGESSISDPIACGNTPDTTPVLDSPNTDLFGGQCSNNTSCNSCLSSPDCFWCDTQKICTSSLDVYTQCQNDPNIYDSFSQCPLRTTIGSSSSTSSSSSSSTSSSSSSTSSSSSSTSSSRTSIIPIIGLSRNPDGSLTTTSLKIIFDSFANQSGAIVDQTSKNNALALVQKELTSYTSNYKTTIHTFVDNVIDYITDDKSLSQAKDINTHIQDLRDVSRYISNFNVITFTEGYQQGPTQSYSDYQFSLFGYEVEKNKALNSTIQSLWLVGLVATGIIFIL